MLMARRDGMEVGSWGEEGWREREDALRRGKIRGRRNHGVGGISGRRDKKEREREKG